MQVKGKVGAGNNLIARKQNKLKKKQQQIEKQETLLLEFPINELHIWPQILIK